MGDPAAETRKKRVPESAAARAARMHGARPFPIAAAKILTLTAKEDFDVTAVVKALESDAPMAARVLRVVNSAVFGLRSKVTSIRQAVTLLGAKGVREATIAGSVLNLFPGKRTESWKALHAHATLAGALARHLADEWRLPADEMFAAAFLHDIGKWILLEQEKDYEVIVEMQGSTFEGTLDEEHGLFGFDHAELGEHMLTAWAIPQPIPQMVGFHHDPAGAFEHSSGMALRVSLLRLVDRLAYAFVNDEEVDFTEVGSSDFCTYLGVTADSLRDRYDALRTMHMLIEDDQDSMHLRIKSAPKLRAVKPRRSEVRDAEAEAAQAAPASSDGEAETPTIYEETCASCGDPAIETHCPRCAAPLCREHDAGKKLCDVCEEKYYQALSNGTAVSVELAIGLTVFGLALFAAAPWIHHVRTPLVAASLVFLFAAIMIAIRRMGFRQRFVRGGGEA